MTVTKLIKLMICTNRLKTLPCACMLMHIYAHSFVIMKFSKTLKKKPRNTTKYLMKISRVNYTFILF